MGHMVNGVIAIDEGLGKRVMEAAGGGASVLKYKKRRISAVRDFPAGCGRNAARVNGKSNENHVAAGDALTAETGDAHKLVGNNGSGAVGGLDQGDSPYLSKALLDEITKEAEDSVKVEEKELVDNSEKVVSDTSSLHSPVESVLPKKPTEEVSSYLQSPVIAPKKIFPRRKVSAFREFPPGCGRNAAPVNLKALRKSTESSKIKGLGQGSPSEDDNAKQNVESDAEQGDGKVVSGDSLENTIKEKRFEDKRQSKSEEMVKKQRVEHVYRKKMSMIHPRDSSDLSESTITKKVGRVIGSSGGNSDLETVKFSKDMSYKRNVPGKPMNETSRASQSQVKPSQSQAKLHVDSYDDREVVQYIMAKQNCPWAPGKKTFTPTSSDRMQVDQGKKTFKSVTGNVSQNELGKKTFKTPDSRGSQSEQGKKIFKPSTGSQSGASISHSSQLSDGREIVLSLASARNCPWRTGKKSIISSGGQAKQR